MVSTLSRISLVTLALVGLSGAAVARDRAVPKRTDRTTSLNGFKPAFRADTSVAGSVRPYSWPVSDRYHPVSQPYFGRSY